MLLTKECPGGEDTSLGFHLSHPPVDEGAPRPDPRLRSTQTRGVRVRSGLRNPWEEWLRITGLT